jgi:hypothetical protein
MFSFMKHKTINIIIIATSLFVVFVQEALAQYTNKFMTRGADTAEFYLSCQWYADINYITWNGIFHSIDNGENLSVQRKTDWYVEGGMVFGDPTPGILYQIPMKGEDTFGVSHDYGMTFEAKYFDGIYKGATGCSAGEIYIRGFEFFRSNDFGDTFSLQASTSPSDLQDVGVVPGEVFAKQSPSGTNPLHLAYSSDFGQTFIVSDVTLPINYQYYDWLDISRGTDPGELYFIVWVHYDSIAVLHSFDYGQTVTLQSWFLQTTDEIFYTAGRTPGSFYIARREICGTPPCLHSCLWIFFSRDYGVTYTTYFHDLDSTYTSSPVVLDPYNISVYPNPASDFLTVEVNPGSPGASIELVNILGDVILQTKMNINDTRQTLDVRDLPKGVYLVQVTQVKGSCKIVKVVIE